MKLRLVLLLAPNLLLAPGFAQTVDIPKGKSITVDGIEIAGEWDDAVHVDFKGGEYIRLKQDGTHLLMSIKGEKGGISSVALHADDQVAILHASAGLITAIYTRQGENWVQTEEFRSERQQLVRAERDNTARMAKNLELIGWCANILPRKPPLNPDHQNITEFMISLDLLLNGVSTMSVVFSQRTATLPMARAPQALADDSLYKPMVHGSNVESLHFEPDTWLKLRW